MSAPDRQTQKLPVSISPCPIIDVVFDTWFDPIIPPEAVFGLIFKAFGDDFPKLESLPGALVPTETRNTNPVLLYQPSHRLMSNDLALLIGPRNFAVGIRGQYPGWTSLRPQFETILRRFDGLGVMTKPQRFGLRYINFFPGNVLPQLRLQFSLEGEPFLAEQTAFRTVIQKPPYDLLLQFANAATVANLPNQVGSIVDIDAYFLNPDIQKGFLLAAQNFLEGAHTAEKSVFFSLLSKPLFDSLNPIMPE
jgi:uncharacterized protein (TIGR04255 family)